MTIAVVGTGYVGLVSAACFAELGHTVWGVDIDEAKVAMLKQGKSPMYEPGLEELIEKNLKNKRLHFTSNLTEALPHVSIVFSAVATPPDENHTADLRAVFAVAEHVARNAEKPLLFVNKSTVPVGTGKKCEEKMNAILQERGKDFSIPVISNPEFLREGMAVPDTMMPERIVVGINGGDSGQETVNSGQWTVDSGTKKTDNRSLATDHSPRDLIEELYRPITRVGKPLVFMSRESAEIVKYAANTFLATKISFINMLTELCEKTGANIRDVAQGIGLDSRIGPRFLHAGIGYGGSCFPKDVKALMATAKEYDTPMPLIDATDAVNVRQRTRFIEMILKELPPNAHVAVWGLSFKPKTDDMREAPSTDVINALINAGHTMSAFDPAAMERAKALMPRISYAADAMNAAKDADALVLLTEWDEFRGADLAALKNTMKGNLLFDGRNVYEPQEAKDAGLVYRGIGI